MASQNLKKLSVYIPLWKRRIPRYPLWSEGNPQLRVFLPLFWMKIVKPPDDIPENQVWFEVHPQMTKFDVKNYLEKIYNVKVGSVRTGILEGKERKHPEKQYTIQPEDYKRFAYVHLADGKTFKFPDMFKEKPTPEEKEMKTLKDMKKERIAQNKKQWHKLDIPEWFR